MPLIIISITNDLYNIVDMKLIIKGLYLIGMNGNTSELIASIICTWSPKICMIISAISMGLATSLIPHLIESFTKKDYKSSNEIFNQAINTMLVIALPLTIGIMILSKETYYLFYGASTYGANILMMAAVVSLWVGILVVMNTAIEGFKKFKLVIISTLIGLVTNTILDIPLILLFNKTGIRPYYGTMVATIIGATVSALIVLGYLKDHLGFNYKSIGKNIEKMIIPLLTMGIVVYLLSYLIGYKDSRIFILIKSTLLGIIGALIYFGIMYKNNGLNLVFGMSQVDAILKKFHLKK